MQGSHRGRARLAFRPLSPMPLPAKIARVTKAHAANVSADSTTSAVTGHEKNQKWIISPDGKVSGNRGGTLELGLGLPTTARLDGSEVAQEAARKFLEIIEPLVSPERYPDLYARFPNRKDLIHHIASVNNTSESTIYRGLKKWNAGGITALTRRVRADKDNARALNSAGIAFIVAAAIPKPGIYGELSTMEVWRAYEEERQWREAHKGKPLSQAQRSQYAGIIDVNGVLLPSAQFLPVSYATVCRLLGRLPELVKIMGRSGQEAYRNSELLSYRDYESIQPMDYVVMDHRVLDLFCLVPERNGWKLARPWITAAIDMRTRKWLAWVIVETPSSDSIATVLKRIFVNFGLPKALYWDNGRDFRCHWLEGRNESVRPVSKINGLPENWTGVLDTLNVRVHHAIVKNARAKLIEPNFGSIADFDRTLPEWCGHKPTARPERFEKLLEEHEAWLEGKRTDPVFRTISQIAELYDAAIEDLNEREHTGEGMRKVAVNGYGWMCPNEAFEIFAKRIERRTISEDVLQLCFARRKELTIANGEARVTFSGRQYHYRLLANRTALLGLNGRKVELAYDPLDLENGAVYHEKAFVGLVSCVELRHMGEDDFVGDERDRRAARREVKRFIQAVHTVPVMDPATRLARRRAVAPSRTMPEQMEVAVQLPAPIMEAHAAMSAERKASFDSIELAGVPAIALPHAAPDTEFRFFAETPVA